MFIRYHIFYYAIGCLLMTLGKSFHGLFYPVFIIYLLWIFYRLDWRYTLITLAISLTIFIPHSSIEPLPETIEGTVIKTSEKYCYLKSDRGTIKLYHEEDFRFRDQVKVIVKSLEMKTASNDNAFDEQLYLYGQKIFYKAQLIKVISKQSHDTLYHWIEEHMSNHSEVNDYQRLFLFGEKNENIQEDYQQLSQLSLVHLFALSGMHIHILYFLIKKVIGLFLSQTPTKWIAYLIIGFYVFSIPMQISLYRAFFVMVLYEIFKKWLNQLDILSLLVILSLLYNPYIIYNISFVFSCFIYFIVLITRHLKSSSLLIYVSSFPIILTLNYQIPMIAFFAGTIFTPFIELLYSLCCLSLIFPILEIALRYCVEVLKLILQFLNAINSYMIFSKPTLSFLIMFYILYLTIVYRKTLRKSIQSQVSMLIALFISFSFYSQYKIYAEVTMIDVGQGDCTFIRLPMNQGNILIDTGGNKDYDLATQTIIPYLKSIGIQHLDYVYISHGDYDHCGALDSLVKNFPVDHIIRDYEDYREIGDMKIEMIKSDQYYSDINDQSLIMKVTLNDCTFLFTGDASSSIEKDLKEKYQQLDVDVVKISHHGSQSATSPYLFEMIQPSIAMIGVKKNNLYRHPSPIVIERLKRKNMTILRTDEDGMFHIRFYGKSRYILR